MNLFIFETPFCFSPKNLAKLPIYQPTQIYIFPFLEFCNYLEDAMQPIIGRIYLPESAPLDRLLGLTSYHPLKGVEYCTTSIQGWNHSRRRAWWICRNVQTKIFPNVL